VSRTRRLSTGGAQSTNDEGWPFGVGDHELISSHRKVVAKYHSGERYGNAGTRFHQARL
jgi:hypothetical protein